MNFRTITMFAMVAAIAFITVAPINAQAGVVTKPLYDNPYSGAWEAMGDDAFLVELTEREQHYASLFIYDFDTPGNTLEVLGDGVYSDASIYFSYVDTGGGNYSWFADTVLGGQGLELGVTPFFGFLFSNGQNEWTEYNLSAENGGYLLCNHNNGMTVLVHDMEPTAIPVPAAALLFGTGLMGVFALRRRQ